MDTVTIFIFFLVVLGGVFFGLFVGFGLIDFHENVVENFRAYQLENSIATKLPDLTTSEKEAFYILQEKEEAYFPIHIKDFEQLKRLRIYQNL